ncbi:MAG: hypothetical protein AAFP04_05440 [Myxococcota bacterium]
MFRRCTLVVVIVGSHLATDSSAQTEPLKGANERPDNDPLPRHEERPLEAMPGVRTRYGSVVTSDGIRLRTLVSMPIAAKQRLRPLLFTQWVSCGSVEYQAGSNAREILARLARDSGLALVRVERAGTGDSQGPGCEVLGYNDEVRHYTEAFGKVLADEQLDSSHVYVYGSSLGSTTAPLVALALQGRGFNIAGIAVQGGGALTHHERMLHFDRIYLERRADEVPRAEIHGEMNRRARFLSEYLIRARNPVALAKSDPELKRAFSDTRGMDENGHYGRPFRWHQEAAAQNFLAAWMQLEAPVLVIFNAFDQFETRQGHRLIVEAVNAARPGTATWVEQAKLGHSSNAFPSIDAAYRGEGGKPAWQKTANVLVRWLRAR